MTTSQSTPYTSEMFSRVTTSSAVPTFLTIPGSAIRTTRSANMEAMLRLWLIIITITPLETAISCIREVMNTWCLMSRLEVGSSRIRISVSWTRPRAMATVWCWPAESSSNGRSESSEIPRTSRTFLTFTTSFGSVFHLDLFALPTRTVSNTGMENTSSDWTGT